MKPAQKPHASLGSLVRTKREAQGLSQQALADAAGVSRESVNRLENATGAWTPRARKVAQILLTLDITVPEVTDTVDDVELHAELVNELGRLATGDFRAYISQRDAPRRRKALNTDLVLISPTGVSCALEVHGPREVKVTIADALSIALGAHGWIVSTPGEAGWIVPTTP